MVDKMAAWRIVLGVEDTAQIPHIMTDKQQ
jgi:hypothetical protein